MIASHTWWHPSAEHFWLFAGMALTGFWSWAASRRAKRIESKSDTGNGKDIGTTVHDIAQTVEVLSAQIHVNTRETLDIASKMVRIDDKLSQHIEEAEPLMEWAREQQKEGSA